MNLVDAVRSAELTIEDVRDHVASDPRTYHRSCVAATDQFELLIKTWLPGQSTEPHDQCGSIVVVQVLQGVAALSYFSRAEDGFVDQQYVSRLAVNQVSGKHDAGVQAIGNPDDQSEVLVTVHLNATPMREYRRFVRRPALSRPHQHEANLWKPVLTSSAPFSVVVIGGGYSGAMTAAQLLQQAGDRSLPLKVTVVERRGALGEGVAYGTRDLNHLLNVPAGRMSAWPDRPDDFLLWAQQSGKSATSYDFLPRQWYGEYIRDRLMQTARQARPSGQLTVLLDEVRHLVRRADRGWLLQLERNDLIQADAVVLAIGHRPPNDPIGPRWQGSRARYLTDPWRPMELDVVGPEDDVVILGSGLSAVDAVLSLTQVPRTGTITMISRRGLLPQTHAPAPVAPVDLTSLVDSLLSTPRGVRAVELSRRVRQTVADWGKQGLDWRCVIDGLRPHTIRLWRAMSLAEKGRFVEHLRPFWEVHRHRMAISISQRFGELHDSDQAHFIAGRVCSAQGTEEAVELVVEQRQARHRLAVHADWVINCTGPTPSNVGAGNPAVGALLVEGWLRPDPLSLGVDATETGMAVSREGVPVENLFMVGTLRKAQDWESTAVPELRIQAAQVAARLIDLMNERTF
jgi:uncharacterized NAD(P)/FAD-binding protein YdhS